MGDAVATQREPPRTEMFGVFGGGIGQTGGPGAFSETFKCFPSSFYAAQKAHIDPESYENSDRILLPPSAMQRLAQLKIDYPMLFELIPHNGAKHLHSGVLEFVAEEGFVYVPFWMMENMQLEEGDLLTIRNASLPKGSFVKFRPQSKTFIELANPRAVLERTMSKFACLTQNQTVRIFYNNKTYDLDVCELKAGGKATQAVSIIEADINVDFDAPADYVEPSAQASHQATGADSSQPFMPSGQFSLAASQGSIALPASVFLDHAIAPPGTTSPPAGTRLSGKAIKRVKSGASSLLLSQITMSAPLVSTPLVVGAYSAVGEHQELGATSGAQCMDGAAAEVLEGGQTLRRTKAH